MVDKERIINEIIMEWGEEFVTDLQSQARKRLKAEGADDMDISVIRATASSAAIIMLDFGEYLRYYDMRKVHRDSNLSPEGIERIKEWIKKEGVENFLSGYKYPTTVTKGGIERPVPITRILNNIAWGISVKKRRLKRKKWYNKNKGTAVYKLYFDLINAIIDNALQEHKQSVLDYQSIPF
jgi:hypothetical protein